MNSAAVFKEMTPRECRVTTGFVQRCANPGVLPCFCDTQPVPSSISGRSFNMVQETSNNASRLASRLFFFSPGSATATLLRSAVPWQRTPLSGRPQCTSLQAGTRRGQPQENRAGISLRMLEKRGIESPNTMSLSRARARKRTRPADSHCSDNLVDPEFRGPGPRVTGTRGTLDSCRKW